MATKAAMEVLGITVNDVVTFIESIISSFITWLDTNFGDEFDTIISEIKLLWEDLQKTIQFYADLIETGVTASVAALKAAWDADFMGMKTTIETVFTFIETVILPIIETMGSVFLLTFENMINIVQLLLALLRGDWKTAWDEAKAIVSNVIDAIKLLINGVGEVFKGLINILIDSLNDGIDAINSISITVPDWVPDIGGDTWSMDIPNIPSLDVGGKVMGGGIARVHPGETMLTKELTAMLEAFFAGGGFSSGGDVYLDSYKVGQILNSNNSTQSSGMGW